MWTKTAGEIPETLAACCRRINGEVHRPRGFLARAEGRAVGAGEAS